MQCLFEASHKWLNALHTQIQIKYIQMRLCTQTDTAAAPAILPSKAISSGGSAVCGYVKKVEARQGMFVALDRVHDARVKMCNLSDG